MGSLYRCGDRACGARRALPADQFRIKRDGTRAIRYREWTRQQKARKALLAHSSHWRRRQRSAASLLQSTPKIGRLDPFPNLEIQEQLQTVVDVTTSQQQQIARVKIGIGLLRDEFDLQAAASQSFPQEITSAHIRTSITKYEDEMSTASKKSDTLDDCGRHENIWDFCASCHTALSRNKIPSSPQQTSSALLCASTIHLNWKALRQLKSVSSRDAILFAPSSNCDLGIQLVTLHCKLGKRAPADADLKSFLQVRKEKVLAALQYLVRYNHLYHDLAINYDMISGWGEDVIPPEIRNNITCLKSSDHHEREGYTVSLQSGNYENDLHAAQDEALDTDEHEPMLTGSVLADINGERQDPNVQLIDTLAKGGATDELEPRQGNIPTIFYARRDPRGQSALVNSWEDPHYLTAAFPTLFPKGIGGHLDQRAVPVSLTAFAEWTLHHHSRRFARHKTFMYLLYDVLQLRSSSLGNALLVKRRNWKLAEDDIASLTVTQLEDAARAIAGGGIIDDPVIQRLQRNIVTIGMQVPESFSQKLKRRSEIKGLIVRDGMPAFWLTINPSDLRNPLALLLAGVEYSASALPTANAALRHATATSNPVAVAQFFHHTCKAVFDGLLGSNTGRIGILG
ncbi:hypothetical protein DL95DRAFT_508538, partial [Leptodontidium sp. 2 PMI_412]